MREVFTDVKFTRVLVIEYDESRLPFANAGDWVEWHPAQLVWIYGKTEVLNASSPEPQLVDPD